MSVRCLPPFKREQDGIVVIDYDRCIGCRYGIAACPYGARFFDFGDNFPAVAEGTHTRRFRLRNTGSSGNGSPTSPHQQCPCTFYLHLQDAGVRCDKAAGRWPACVKTCTGHAMFFGDLNDPESEVSRLLREWQTVRLREELGTELNVHYLL